MRKAIGLLVVLAILAGGFRWWQHQYTPDDEEDLTSNWIEFNGTRDVGVSLDVSFSHPQEWFAVSSIDSGAGSVIPFHKKSEFPEEWKQYETNDRALIRLPRESSVATVVTSISPVYPTIRYENQVDWDIQISDKQGKIHSGTDIVTGEERMAVVIPIDQSESVDAVFIFSMPINNHNDREIFTEIVNSITF